MELLNTGFLTRPKRKTGVCFFPPCPIPSFENCLVQKCLFKPHLSQTEDILIDVLDSYSAHGLRIGFFSVSRDLSLGPFSSGSEWVSSLSQLSPLVEVTDLGWLSRILLKSTSNWTEPSS